MECKYAYMKKNIPYVLCSKEPEPKGIDRKELFHAVCGHQAHCPKENCHKLTGSWLRCVKLAERNQMAYEEALGVAESTEAKAPKTRPRSRRKPQNEE